MLRTISTLGLMAVVLSLVPAPPGSAAPTVPTAPLAPATTCTGSTVPLRMVTGTTSSLLTASSKTAALAATTQLQGALYRGSVVMGAAAQGPGRVAVTRYRSGDDYTYVTDTATRRSAEKAGYRADGETFYGSATPAPGCTVVVYQLQRGASHQLAVNGIGVESLAKEGWVVQGPVLYGAELPGRARAMASGPVAEALPAKDKDRVFGMVVLPDTQEEVHTDKDVRLRQRAQYIADHRKSWDTRLGVSVGDIADWDAPDHAHYARAAEQLEPLVGAMPFVAAVGNHDTQAVCPGGSACVGLRAKVTLRDTTVFNSYFPADRFSLLSGQYEEGKIDNAYHTFRAGDVDWLVLNLELWPRPEVVDWAAAVVAANPRKNVIVVTHSYLTSSGKIMTDNGGYGSTAPEYLWNRVVKVYPNVKIVLSGHTGRDRVRIDKGQHGNRIVSYLQCFHSRTDNPFRRLTIDTKKRKIRSTIYTPSNGKKVKNETVTGLKFVR